MHYIYPLTLSHPCPSWDAFDIGRILERRTHAEQCFWGRRKHFCWRSIFISQHFCSVSFPEYLTWPVMRLAAASLAGRAHFFHSQYFYDFRSLVRRLWVLLFLFFSIVHGVLS
jgi:hypothetical protein